MVVKTNGLFAALVVTVSPSSCFLWYGPEHCWVVGAVQLVPVLVMVEGPHSLGRAAASHTGPSWAEQRWAGADLSRAASVAPHTHAGRRYRVQ